MGYTRQAVKGVSWFGAFRAGSRVIAFLKTAILARLLTPAQFGFFAIASLVLSFLELITETGINIVLIQKTHDIDDYLNTAWIVSMIRGVIIGGIVFICAYPVSVFFHSPGSLPLVLLMGFVPIIRGFINPAEVKMDKELKFQALFFFRFSLFLFESVMSILVVFITHSPIGMVWGLIAGALLEVVMSFVFLKPRPTLTFHKLYFYDILHHGKWLTVIGVTSYLYQNIDNIVIGRIMGASPLGLYDTAYKISLVPLTEITDVVARGTFPVYVKISHDIGRLRRAYFKSVGIIFVFSFLCALILFLFPRQVILIALGNKWISAAPVLQVLGILGMFRALSISVVHPLYALRKQKMVTLIMICNLAVLGVLIVPFVMRWGIIGAAYAALLGTILPLPLICYFVYKTLEVGKHERV